MAVLPNDAGSMRLAVGLVDREAPVGGGLPALAGVPSGRILCTAAVEHFDRRDREWWPFVRLPALHLGGQAAHALVEGARQLLAGSSPLTSQYRVRVITSGFASRAQMRLTSDRVFASVSASRRIAMRTLATYPAE